MLTGILGLVMLWFACLPANAAAVREPVQAIQPLLISAIQQGQAQGVLVGPAADAIASQFVSRAPILVDVTVIAALPTPGCKRLRVDTRQDQVVDRARSTAAGKPGQLLPAKPMRLQYDISFCENGTFAPGTRPAAPASTAKPAEST